MNRLSLVDGLFLYLETPQTPMNIASLTIFTQTSPEPDLFARFREHTAARLDLLPSYRRRLEMTPLGLDHPVWVVDDPLDLDHHIRHVALPKPGTMEQLRALVAELHAVPLDRARPLWEYHLIEGLENGAFAVYIKLHHCDMDGIAGMSTLASATISHLTAGRRPRLAERVRLERRARRLPGIDQHGDRRFHSPGISRRQIAARRRENAGEGGSQFQSRRALSSRLRERDAANAVQCGDISPSDYATCSLPLADVKKVAKSRGVTINDLVLALARARCAAISSSITRYPSAPLIAGVPASLRAPGDGTLNNQVVFSLSRLPTDLADPLPRLAAARLAAEEAKGLFADVRDLLTTDISIVGAPLIITALARLMAGARAYNLMRPFFNVVISNVPGPREPMYCVGAPATTLFPGVDPLPRLRA